MKFLPMLMLVGLLAAAGCPQPRPAQASQEGRAADQGKLKNETLRSHDFLAAMYSDDYFPDPMVDKVKAVLVELCFQIERESPKDLKELYGLTHAATNRINGLQDEFFENGSEIETAAREAIAADFEFIATAYGFQADIEELIGTREW